MYLIPGFSRSLEACRSVSTTAERARRSQHRLERASRVLLAAMASLLSACGGQGASAPPAEAPSAGAADEAAQTGAQDVGQAPTLAVAAPRQLPDFCAGVATATPSPLTGKPALVKDGFVFVEGPVWSEAAGAFFFSEMDFGRQGPNGPPSKIHKLVLPATFEVFIPESGSNGLAIDAQGLVACTHDNQTLSRYDLATRARSTLIADYRGKHFNSPNDVALHSAGHIYFTDPDWQIGQRPNETGVTGVYFRSASGDLTQFDAELQRPNGVTLSPDETRLYVGSASGEVHVYPILADGTPGPRQLFAAVQEPDGMGVDCAGRLYVTSHGPGEVVILSPSGEVVSKIPVAPRATNVAFGGPDRRTLLITAGAGVYAMQVPIPGFPY